MKTFPTNFNTEKNKKTGASPVWILKCPFPSTGTIYLSDRSFTVAGWNGGITTKSWVAAWGQIDEDIAGEMALSKVSDFSLDVINDPGANPNINAILWTAANNIEVTDCELYLWFLGLDASIDPPQKMWTGNIVDFEKLNELVYRLDLVDISVRLDKDIGTKINTADYPNADPDEIGKVANIVYGSVKNVPCHAIKAGAASPLVADITASATSCEVSDASRFPSAPFTVQCEKEQMRVTAKNGNVFTITRGYNSTTAVPHDKGMAVFEVLSEYIYLVADHPVKAIGDVYVDDVRQVANLTKYTGQTGSEKAGYEGKAVIVFSVKPVIEKQVNIQVNDTIAVNDGITVSDNIGFTSAVATKKVYPNSGTYSAIYDGNESTKRTSSGETLSVGFPSTNYGVIVTQYIYIVANFWGVKTITNSGWSPSTIIGDSGKGTYRVQKSGGNWSDGWSGGVQLGIDVYEIWKEVEYIPAMTKSGAAFKSGAVIKSGTVTLSGNSSADAVIGRLVTADVDGYQDDASGTYTGTANALIERPDHIFKHFLNTYAGWPIADFYTNAGSQFASKNYKFSVLINEYKRLKEWLSSMAFQCRCYFRFSAGKAQLMWRPDSLTSQKNITSNMIRMQDDYKTSMRVRRSPLHEVINKITIHYDKNWSKTGDEAYKRLSQASDSVSVNKYGEKERPELFYFDFITIDAMANDLRDFYLARYKDRKKLLEMEVFLDNSELEFADALTIEPQSNLLCETQKVNIYPGSGKDMRNDRITLVAREY
ncbi:hypothetical protein A45J_0409 [hot springs metagenome]|uniref:Tip attachment protein J domain-containing protein n=1 Tax=hot springs metagenome TaxID=433727 RepID=A0A5J4L1N0_9ZZZZ